MPSLEELSRLHAHWIALAEAGIVIGPGLGDTPQAIRATLDLCAAQIAEQGERMEQDAGLAAVVAECTDLPEAYRKIVLQGLSSGFISAPLERHRPLAGAAEEIRALVRRALFYPLVLAAFATLGLLFLCVGYFPVLERTVDQIRATPPWSLRVLRGVNANLWVWVLLASLAWLGAALLWHRNRDKDFGAVGRRRGLSSRLPGVRRYFSDVENAQIAQRMADWIDQGVGRDGIAQGRGAGEPASFLPSLRPFLTWALGSGMDDADKVRTLRFAAETYAQSARRQLALLRMALPAIACVFIGGAAVLCFGFFVFAPMTGFLETLAQTTNPQ